MLVVIGTLQWYLRFSHDSLLQAQMADACIFFRFDTITLVQVILGSTLYRAYARHSQENYKWYNCLTHLR